MEGREAQRDGHTLTIGTASKHQNKNSKSSLFDPKAMSSPGPRMWVGLREETNRQTEERSTWTGAHSTDRQAGYHAAGGFILRGFNLKVALRGHVTPTICMCQDT